ncbi:conserved hypothetical protein [Frankia canadensis]|uniref:Uncharacterized protein n=1 Tax=Frankia canadensis TaxID=1836972 RepID=A0A2I2L0X9_9ACTN|nr:hypothetical protein [Frankia canadensis]SNQ51583.1 conserved hypothetical protein [Frankia canadensis]SOU58873.1 conserved hypothetical protein [Frankia canadensis]
MRTTGTSLNRAVTIADATVYRARAVDTSGVVAAEAGRGPGVLMPAAYAARHPWERAYAHAECLLAADVDAVVHVRARWLQLTSLAGLPSPPPVLHHAAGPRPVRHGLGDARRAPGIPPDATTPTGTDDPLVAFGQPGDGETWGDDAGTRPAGRRVKFLAREVERDVVVADLLAARPQPLPGPAAGWSRGWLPHPSAARPSPWEPVRTPGSGHGRGDAASHTVTLHAPPGRSVREIAAGEERTRVAWDTWSGRGELRLSAGVERGAPGLIRLRVELVNTSGWQPRMDAVEWTAAATQPAARQRALRHALVGAHVVLSGDPGEARFLSLAAPPDWASALARTCVNDGLWPALIGGHRTGGTVLIAPIRLPDDPDPRPRSVDPAT